MIIIDKVFINNSIAPVLQASSFVRILVFNRRQQLVQPEVFSVQSVKRSSINTVRLWNQLAIRQISNQWKPDRIGGIQAETCKKKFQAQSHVQVCNKTIHMQS
jgi:hypothetical protein